MAEELGFSIIMKEAGESVAEGRVSLYFFHRHCPLLCLFILYIFSGGGKQEFEEFVKTSLWNGTSRNTCRFVYNLDKKLSGLCLVSRSDRHLLKIRELMSGDRPSIRFKFRCIVVGAFEGGDKHVLRTNIKDCPVVNLQVIKTRRCVFDLYSVPNIHILTIFCLILPLVCFLPVPNLPFHSHFLSHPYRFTGWREG